MPFYPPGHSGGNRETFDFLGFTHYWAASRKGRALVERQTMSKRLTRALEGLRQYCRENRHEPLEELWKGIGIDSDSDSDPDAAWVAGDSQH